MVCVIGVVMVVCDVLLVYWFFDVWFEDIVLNLLGVVYVMYVFVGMLVDVW